jgi:putative membrane protein
MAGRGGTEISDRTLRTLLAAIVVVALLAAIGARDLGIWALEVVPIAIVVPVLWCTRRWLRFTPLLYGLIAAHCLVLIIGAHWTYEHVPAGNWLNDALGWQRNDYDRLGHFAQGFVPVLAVREILIRRTELSSRRVVVLLALFVTMGASALYEIVEMLLAVTGGAAARVDSQGDIWDPEWDMFFCFLGAVTSLTLLGRVHDRQIARVEAVPRRGTPTPSSAAA